jgi:DNA-binding NarL/FixJ family response regulator
MSALMQQPGPGAQRPPIAVLVVDDQQAVREGVARLIACGTLALRGVATAATADEALAHIRLSPPDVVVLDVDLDGADGLALIPQFAPATRVLVLTSHGDPDTRARARRLGVLGFVEKHEPASALLASLAAVAFPRPAGASAPMAVGQDSQGGRAHSSDSPDAPRS